MDFLCGTVNGALADTTTLTYDKASRLVTADSQRYSNQITYSYHDDSTIATENITGIGGGPNGYTVTRGYDPDNRLTSITHPDGSVTSRTYTARHQLESVTHDGTPIVTNIVYDPGMREQLRINLGGLHRANTYARQDNLTTGIAIGTVPNTNDRPGLSWAYSYDANKNLASATTGGTMSGVSFTTAQDSENRLTSWTRTNGEDQSWAFGTRVKSLPSFARPANRLSGVGLHRRPAAGPPASTSLSASPLDRARADGILSTRVPSLVGDWNSNAGQKLQGGTVYPFDELRNHDAVHQLQSITGGLVRHTTWQPVEMPRVSRGRAKIACRKARKRPLAVATGSFVNEATRDFRRPAGSWGIATGCRGSYVDEPLSLHVKAGVNAGNTYWYHLDRQYNVIGLTNSSGQVVERYAYTAYGARRVLDPNGVTERSYSAFGNARGHQGLWHDDETNLIYNRARYRSSVLGRWMGRDRLGYVDGMGLYGYLDGSVLRRFDPTGLFFGGSPGPGEEGHSCRQCYKCQNNQCKPDRVKILEHRVRRESCRQGATEEIARRLHAAQIAYSAATEAFDSVVATRKRNCENQFDRASVFYEVNVFGCKRAIDAASTVQAAALFTAFETIQVALGIAIYEAWADCNQDNPCWQARL